MNTFESLIFVPEGTLLNEKLALKTALRQTLKKQQRNFGPSERLKYTQLSNGFKLLSEGQQIQLLLQNFLPDHVNAQETFYGFLRKQHQLIKNSRDFLEQVKGKLNLVALGKERKAELLPRLKEAQIADYFETLYFADDFTTKFPEKNNLIQVVNDLQLDPDTSLVVGSNLTEEIQAAENAHLKSLWLTPKREKISITPHPTLHLSRLLDLLFYLNI